MNQTFHLSPDFETFLKDVSNSSGITNTSAYFVKPVDPNTKEFDPLYHITTKFCGTNQEACAAYAAKHAEYINATFEMELVGFVFTNRTFGIRVNLKDVQKTLFEEGTPFSKDAENTEETEEEPLPSAVETFPGVTLQAQEYPSNYPVTTTRAHVTLGCAPGVPAVTTGPDMVEVINYEIRLGNGATQVTTWNITDPMDSSKEMMVALYKPSEEASDPKDFIFVVYPRVKIMADAVLTPYIQDKSASARVFSCQFLVLLSSFIALSLIFRREW